MRQLADRMNITATQTTPDALVGSQTSPGIRTPPWSSRICLPLLSENNRVLWVHAHEVNMQPDKVVELNKAFDRFPYLTHKQTAALAQHCSLHPDQVKVWFMDQRLRYGISWDYKDIIEIWNKLKSNHEDNEEDEVFQDWNVKDDEVKNKDQKGDEKECGGKKQSAEVVPSLNSTLEQEQPTKKETRRKGKEDGASSPLKRKRRSVRLKRGRKRMKQDDERITDRAEKLGAKLKTAKNEGETSSTCEGAVLTEKIRRAKMKLISSLLKPSHGNLLAVKSSFEKKIEPLAGLEEKNSLSHSADRAAPRTDARVKTKSQLFMLRSIFLEFQYPDSEQYSLLSGMFGINRHYLVQWFGDHRYAVKKSKPCWMTEEKYKEVLANIKNRQNRKGRPKPVAAGPGL